jgi:putative endonuclease
MPTKIVGNLGEDIAVKFLEQKGYKILARNYKFAVLGPQKGEVDIIAKKDDVICFVEVKTLTSDKSFSPEAKVDFIKMRKIAKTAQSWMMKNKIGFDSPWRIDVVAVVIDGKTQKAQVRHLENAIC